MYLVDANNLAGQLGWLEQGNFGPKLTQALLAYFRARNKKAIIVFDGNDWLAGQQDYGPIKVIYTASDCSADDKIVSLISRARRGQAFSLVTNDRELARRALQAAGAGKAIKIVKAVEFARLLLAPEQSPLAGVGDDDDKQLDRSEIKKINQELLKLWTD